MWIFTVPLPIILALFSPTLISTIFKPVFCISSATSFEITLSFSTNTSPVDGSIISSNATFLSLIVDRLYRISAGVINRSKSYTL